MSQRPERAVDYNSDSRASDSGGEHLLLLRAKELKVDRLLTRFHGTHRVPVFNRWARRPQNVDERPFFTPTGAWNGNVQEVWEQEASS